MRLASCRSANWNKGIRYITTFCVCAHVNANKWASIYICFFSLDLCGSIHKELEEPSVWTMFWWFAHVCLFYRRLALMLMPVQCVLIRINQEMYYQFSHASMYVCLSIHSVFTINLNFSSLSALNVAIWCVCVCSHFFHKSCIEPWLLEHRTCPMCKCDILKALGVEVSFHTKGGRTPDAKRSAVSRRAMSLKFEHIVFYVCTHTDGIIQRLSAAPSNDSGCCSNSCRATERHLHCFILNNIIFVSNRC